MAQDLTYRDALRATLMEEMDRNPAVVLLGEDIGVYQGTFRITADFLTRFGPKRVIDTPIAELGFVGAAVGMAMLGLRPVVEVMTWNFSLLAADQILNNAAKLRYFSGGQVNVPLVIRGPNGAGVQLSAQHSQSLEALYAHFPGLWVVAPATPADARGLLLTALRGKDPVVFLENAALYGAKGHGGGGDHPAHAATAGPRDADPLRAADAPGGGGAGAMAALRRRRRDCGGHLRGRLCPAGRAGGARHRSGCADALRPQPGTAGPPPRARHRRRGRADPLPPVGDDPDGRGGQAEDGGRHDGG